jgi:hypothetical protein
MMGFFLAPAWRGLQVSTNKPPTLYPVISDIDALLTEVLEKFVWCMTAPRQGLFTVRWSPRQTGLAIRR